MISELRTTERLGRIEPPAGPDPVRDRDPHGFRDVGTAVDPPFDGIPATPPAEVMAEVDAAFDRLHEIREAGLELRYDISDRSRIRVDLVDAAGEVVRRVPPTEALELAVGAGPVPLASPPGTGAADPAGLDEAAPTVTRVDREA
ncbi:MAG: hypothetical protein AB7G37_21200 [Solirubrobacteraceae bacterium]